MGSIVRLDESLVTGVLERALRRRNFDAERAALCARLFTETSLDGVSSHGLNRFPRFLGQIDSGVVDPRAIPSVIRASGPFETWDGHLGPGNLNAWACMGRAVKLAGRHGMAAVALRNTNHWMRGGTYGLQAARAGCIGICMTNTLPNMPPWGGREATLGNNPLVLSAPNDPYPVLLDMAMSQFSYGRMEILRQEGRKLPFPGGFDRELGMTDDPGEILDSELAMPMGYWKGSGLAMLIDLLVSILSGGLTTREIGQRVEEFGVSQLFIAFDLHVCTGSGQQEELVRQVTDFLNATAPLEPGTQAYFPGQRTWLRRLENQRLGIPVDETVWETIRDVAGKA